MENPSFIGFFKVFHKSLPVDFLFFFSTAIFSPRPFSTQQNINKHFSVENLYLTAFIFAVMSLTIWANS